MKELLKDGFPDYLESIRETPQSGLRVNTLKTTPERAAELLKLSDRVPWTENGFYLPEEKGFTKSPYYYAGLYYIQEPSAMSSAALLGTEPGDRVLDLCAAPGGKTTEIGATLKGRGVLYANDLSASRAKALLKNIEVFGIGNAFITCEESSRLKKEFPYWFDRILVDAPCSGEGMFRKHPAVIRAWEEHGKDFYCPVQRVLLDDAAEMLKEGGTLLYSTCTYNPHEDEDQIIRFLSDHPEFGLDRIPPCEGFTDSWLLPGCVRLLPHKARAEGHFVARLKKKGEKRASSEGTAYVQGTGYGGGPSYGTAQGRNRKAALPEDLSAFLGIIRREFQESNILIQGEYVSYLPDTAAYRKDLRYLRTGLLLGQLKNGRFRPSQALAMNLTKDEWPDPVLFGIDDPRVVRYLRGETVEADEDGKGVRLLCVDGFPLGFVKQDRQRLKNMYLPGWRMQ